MLSVLQRSEETVSGLIVFLDHMRFWGWAWWYIDLSAYFASLLCLTSINIAFPFSLLLLPDLNRFLWILDADSSSASNYPSIEGIHPYAR